MDRSTLDISAGRLTENLSEHAECIKALLRAITHALEHEYSCTPEQWTTFRGEMTEALQKAWGQHGLTDDHGWKQLEPAILVQAVRVVGEQQWNTDHNDVTAAFMVADELETMRRDDCSFNDGMKTSLAPGQIGDEAPRSDQGLTGTRALPTGTAEHTLLPIEFRECLGKLLNELPTALKVQLIQEAETRSRQRPLAQTCRMKQGSGRYPKGMQQEPSSTNNAIDEEHESTGQLSSCLHYRPTPSKRATSDKQCTAPQQRETCSGLAESNEVLGKDREIKVIRGGQTREQLYPNLNVNMQQGEEDEDSEVSSFTGTNTNSSNPTDYSEEELWLN